MISAAHTLLRSTIFGLLALALLSLPFAHKTGVAPLSAQAVQFVAMGGILDDICGSGGSHPSAGCESCRIVDDTSAPAIGQKWQPSPCHDTADKRLQSDSTPTFPLPHHSPPARAPPVI